MTTPPADLTAVGAAPAALHEPPAAVRVRGTIALLTGAGESAPVYARLGRRLAADGYTVGVFEGGRGADAEAWLVRAPHTPRVLAGSDRGGAAALALAASSAAARAAVDGVIVAGVPVGTGDSRAEAAQRTACPVHLAVLAEAAVDAGAGAAPGVTPDAADPAADAVADAADAADAAVPPAEALASIAVPVLAVHGGADPLAPFAQARDALAALPGLELVETVGGLHDAFNDVSHRSVAATIVLWLERLRGGDIGRPVVRRVAP